MTDHERPLNGRGRRAADDVAKALTARGFAPDLIWASDSQRTMETAKHLIRNIPGAQTVLRNPALYHASASQIMDICKQETPPSAKCLMILAHNPGMGDLYHHWTGRQHRYPTGCCAVFKRVNDGPWMSPNTWRAIDLILPRELEP